MLGFNYMSTIVGHFVSSPREREKRDRRDSRSDEREEQKRKRNRNESEETEEIKTAGSCVWSTSQSGEESAAASVKLGWARNKII